MSASHIHPIPSHPIPLKLKQSCNRSKEGREAVLSTGHPLFSIYPKSSRQSQQRTMITDGAASPLGCSSYSHRHHRSCCPTARNCHLLCYYQHKQYIARVLPAASRTISELAEGSEVALRSDIRPLIFQLFLFQGHGQKSLSQNKKNPPPKYWHYTLYKHLSPN